MLVLRFEKVVPGQMAQFYEAVGDSEDILSKLFSLRKYVYDIDEDSTGCKIGSFFCHYLLLFL